MKNYKEQLKDITTFVFDYDGVMTSGDVLVDGNGVPLRSSDVKDGYALQLAARLGYNIAVITGGYSISIEKRMQMLGVKDVFVRSANKVEVLQKYMETNNLKPEQIIYTSTGKDGITMGFYSLKSSFVSFLAMSQ